MSWKLTPRMILIIIHDLLAAVLAVLAAFYIRFEAHGLAQRWSLLLMLVPAFAVYAAGTYWFFGLFKNKWRFTSLPDVMIVVKVATVLALTLLAVDYQLLAPNLYGTYFFGKLTIILYWFLQIFFLLGMRVAYRYFRYTRTLQHARQDGFAPTLVLGPAADAEVLLRSIESGAVKRLQVVGVLSPSRADRGQSIRNVPVVGDFADLERVVQDFASRGTVVTRLVMTPSALAPEMKPETLLTRARRIGLTPSRMPGIEDGGDALRLAPIQVEDLLLRPTVKIDYHRLEAFVRDRKAAVVTGGGGSIGSEICDRLVTYGITRLLVIENSEPALHGVLEALRLKRAKVKIDGRIADVRDRDRITRLITAFNPDIVFHAAALKHVPLLERDWEEGVKTNVFGSVNVADAAVAAGAAAMVMISTDKAIEPISILGATKRFAEMYCQALDTDHGAHPAGRTPTRFIAVRFGNVLASDGSVVPRFKAQIEAGGPVTVTHPDMVRYFMTIREACDLVVTAASHALSPQRSDVSVYVLNMGQPVRIVDLAERMIRLSGLEPGKDIDITFTGVRPGERLNEILFAADEPAADIGIAGIVATRPVSPGLPTLCAWLAKLEKALKCNDREAIYRALQDAVPGFRKEAV
ncbi:MAG: polysaccharide biosynthesis protein [Bradyrhizobiaceae bacterium]|nr:polysaccharide biosynthesis protein [Bradyrhizobiaceae bacterium]